MRDLTSLIILNILTVICSIPIVTAGTAIASMHYVLFQMIEDKEGHIASSYMKQFRGNLKSATPVWLIILFASGLLFFEYSTFKNAGGAGRAVIMFAYAGFLLIAMLSVWIFPLTAKFVHPVGAYFRNALILCISKLFRTVAMVVIMSVIPFILTHDLRLAPLAVLIGISLPSYFCALIYHPVIAQMIKDSLKQSEDRKDPADEDWEES